MGYFRCSGCGVASYSQASDPHCPECNRELLDGDTPREPTTTDREVRLHGGALAPSEARDMIDAWRGEIEEPLLSTVKLLVSELVTNRVALTGCSSVGLALTVRDELIRVAGSDHGQVDASHDGDGASRSADWGLHLVEALADKWDAEDGDPPLVWFEIERRRMPDVSQA